MQYLIVPAYIDINLLFEKLFEHTLKLSITVDKSPNGDWLISGEGLEDFMGPRHLYSLESWIEAETVLFKGMVERALIDFGYGEIKISRAEME